MDASAQRSETVVAVSSGRQEWWKFLRFVALGAFAPLVIKLFIVVVDPLGFNNLVRIKGFNAYRHYQSWAGLQYKTFAVRDYRPDAIIYGPSSIQFGFVPECAGSTLRLSKIYNFGQGGAGPKDLLIHFEDFAALGTVRRMLLEARFTSHSINFGIQAADPAPANPVLGWIMTLLRPFIPGARVAKLVEDPLTLGELELGLKTIYANATLDPRLLSDTYRPDGSFDPNYARYLAAKAISRDHVVGHTENYFRTFIRNLQLTWSPDFRYLDRLAARAKVEGIGLDLFVPPVHVSEMMMYNEGGAWPLFEYFKLALHAKVAELRREIGVDIRAFDFGNLTEVTSEPVDESTTYFQDPVHFRRPTGDIILAGVFGCRSNVAIPAGAMLDITSITASQVEAHLADERKKLAAFRREHPELVDLVAKGLNGLAIGPRVW